MLSSVGYIRTTIIPQNIKKNLSAVLKTKQSEAENDRLGVVISTTKKLTVLL